MATINKTGPGSPQFGRASGGVTHFCRQIHFSTNLLCAEAEFADQEKFASFSPEFLALNKVTGICAGAS